jgi:16S rRNA U516 pseudouridylate synthase RsuA-like enzyme
VLVPQRKSGQDNEEDDADGYDDDDDDEVAINDLNGNNSRSSRTSTGPGGEGDSLGEVEVEVRTSRVRLSVREGKYRMVRRILHNAGHSVLQLHRLRYGNLFLGDVEEGEVRPCNSDERTWALSVLTNASKKK